MSRSRNVADFVTPKTAMAVAFGLAVCLSVGIIAALGAERTGIIRALQGSARFSFLLFWCAYAGGALAKLFGSRFRILVQYRREFGLGFAAAQSVHLGLVIWLFRISATPPVAAATFIFFTIATLLMYGLVVFSIPRLQRAIGANTWRRLRVISLEYISFAFLVDFAFRPLPADAASLLAYLPFVILSVSGTVLRLWAWSRFDGSSLNKILIR